MKRIVAGTLAACAVCTALLVGAASSHAAIICPPPPCEPPVVQSGQIVCPLKSASAIAVYPCGCPIALTGGAIPIPVDGCVDLAVTETVDRAHATVGDLLTYKVEVRNAGPDAAMGVTVLDTLPAGLALVSATGPSSGCSTGPPVSCTLGSVGAGDGAGATIVARATQAGDIANTAGATSAGLDSDPSNNHATATTHVSPAPVPGPNPPGGSPRPARYCSPSGDLCYGVLHGKPVRLSLTLAGRYFKRYALCVTSPSDKTDCRRLRVHRLRHGLWGSTVRWARRFPKRGRGTYVASWSAHRQPLGPPVAFAR